MHCSLLSSWCRWDGRPPPHPPYSVAINQVFPTNLRCIHSLLTAKELSYFKCDSYSWLEQMGFTLKSLKCLLKSNRSNLTVSVNVILSSNQTCSCRASQFITTVIFLQTTWFATQWPPRGYACSAGTCTAGEVLWVCWCLTLIGLLWAGAKRAKGVFALSVPPWVMSYNG